MCGWMLRGDARPLIADRRSRSPSVRLLQLDADGAAARRVADGVVEQVDDQPANQILVAGERAPSGRVTGSIDTSLGDASTRAARTTSSTTSSRYIGVVRTG